MWLFTIIWLISLALTIFIVRLTFEIPKFSKRSDELITTQHTTVELLRAQNELLALILRSALENKKIGLINKATSEIKIIDASELKNYKLSDYDVQIQTR